MSDRFRSEGTVCAVFALLLSMPLAASSSAQTGDTGLPLNMSFRGAQRRGIWVGEIQAARAPAQIPRYARDDAFARRRTANEYEIPTGPDAPVWNVPNEGSYFNGPAIGPDGTIYIGTSEAGVSDALTTHGLYAVDRNGRTKWKYTTGKSIKSSPVIGPDGTIYIMVGIGTDTDAYGLDSSLVAVDPQGHLKWECPNLGSFGVGPVPDSPPSWCTIPPATNLAPTRLRTRSRLLS